MKYILKGDSPKDSIKNTFNVPLKPFVQIIIRLLEKNYIA